MNLRSILAVTGASGTLLVPCFWQSRIQAGDLSSHIYNAWLSLLIERGEVTGVSLARQWSNVLFDLALSGLLRIFGPGAAQRIAVSASVLIFVWGSFALVSAVSNRRAWHMLPCLAMAAYGWAFHMGFFNFYLSMGLCFWALALLWKGTRAGMIAAVPLLILASAAHLLAVGWALGVIAWVWIGGRVSSRHRVMLAGVVVGAMVLRRLVFPAPYDVSWSIFQVFAVSGADQVVVYRARYCLIAIGLMALQAGMLLRDTEPRRLLDLAGELPFQIWLLTSAGVLLFPSGIDFAAYRHVLCYITDRMSLATAVLMCVLLGSITPTRFERAAFAVMLIAFAAFLYSDTRELNQLEDKVDAAVRALPPGRRVVSALCNPDLRVNATPHMIDRACIGRCFSYGNYEPSTDQFRVRAPRDNAVVVSEYRDAYALERGHYIVRERDLPLYQIGVCDQRRETLCVRSLKRGELHTCAAL